MRNNQPVTHVEKQLAEGAFIVSMTDLQGTLTFVNDEFVAISGFTREELLGQPHNMIRHPDMPPAAFADLWATVKRGGTWQGMVKNRTRSGDFYWVDATVSPVVEHGRPVGYVSVRCKPSPAQVMEATRLYQEMQAGKASGTVFKQPWVPFPAMSFRTRLWGGAGTVLLLFGILSLLNLGVLVAGVRDSGRQWRPRHGLRLNWGPYPSRPRPSRVAA
jgi:aerotaxis receptor